jgi:hypothetical protein
MKAVQANCRCVPQRLTNATSTVHYQPSSIDISSTSIRYVMGSSVEWRLPRFKQQSTDAIRSRIEIGIPPVEVTPL